MSSTSSPALPILDRLENPSSNEFTTPSKRINDREDLSFFFTSTAYRDLTKWLLQLNRAVFPSMQADGKATVHFITTTSSPASLHAAKIAALLDDLASLIQQAPPDTGPRRFGNVAFRKWYQLAEENSVKLLRSHLDGVIAPALLHDASGHSPVLEELNAYLLGSFGSAQRLDYGTGHELSFLAFLGCLWKLGAFKRGEEQAIVTGTIQPYLVLIRELILAYTLEPAGSHGVWGLDDHSFLPYIFGSAQLGPPISHSDYSIPVPTEGSLPTAPSPSSVTNKAVVGDFKDSNMYFSAIQFIFDVKKGPFWEHSPVLYDISGIKDGWGKINKGMLKMYAAEVLGKFPVVQHFPFGSLFAWQKDSEARPMPVSVHAQHQPTATQHTDAQPASGIRTAVPWVRAGGSALPQVQASTGMPSMRAPWAASSVSSRPSAVPVAAGARNADPRTEAERSASNNITGTAAPWAERHQGR